MTLNRNFLQKAAHRAGKEFKGIARDDIGGFDEAKKHPILYALGITAVQKGVVSTGRVVKDAAHDLSTVATRALGKDGAEPLPTDSDDASERFAIAQECYGRSNADVRQMQHRSSRQFTVLFIATVLSLAWGILLLPQALGVAEGAMRYIAPVWPFFLIFALGPLTARAGFWNWQLRTRRLGSFGEYVRNPSVWMAQAPDGSDAKHVIKSLVLLLFAGALIAPSTAYAAGYDWTVDIKPTSQDLFFNMLKILVPGIGPIPEGPVDGNLSPFAGPLKGAFMAFNASLLTLGSIMVGWHTLSGAISTAQEGKVLGQRWHQIWAPLRVSVGVGTLAPVSGGYCVAQVIVIQLIAWGGGLANEVYSGYMDSFQEKTYEEALATIPQPFEVVPGSLQYQSKQFIRGLAEKEICYETLAQRIYATGEAGMDYGVMDALGHVVPFNVSAWQKTSHAVAGTTIVPVDANGKPTYPSMEEVPVDTFMVATGEDEGPMAVEKTKYKYVWDYGPACGKIVFDPTFDNPDASWLGDDADLVDLQNAVEARYVVGEKVAPYIDAARVLVRTFAIDWVKYHSSVAEGEAPERIGMTGNTMPETLDKAITYAGNLSVDGATSAFGALQSSISGQLAQTFVPEAEKLGWASAGMFYNTISRLQNATVLLTTFEPKVEPFNPLFVDEGSDAYSDLFGPEITDSDGERDWNKGTVSSFMQTWENNFADKTVTIDENAAIAGALDDDGTAEDMGGLSGIAIGTMSKSIEMMSVDPFDPMSELIGLGHTMLWMFTIMGAAYLGIGKVASAVTKLFGASPGGAGAKALVGKIAGPIADIITGPLGFMVKIALFLLFAAGVMHAYVLPMIPYMYWYFFVVGMLVLTCEALIAAPLWAFFHIRMDGQEFVDQVQRPGYMIAFNLLLRPTLGLFGLFLSYGIMGAGVWFLQKTFYPAALSAMAGEGTGMIGALTMTIILTYMHWQIALRSFGLITQVPDRVTRWFGQGGEQLGEDQEAQKGVSFLVGGIQNNVRGMGQAAAIRGAVGGKTGNPQEGEEDKKDPP